MPDEPDIIVPMPDVQTGSQVDPFLRLPQVLRITGLSKSTLKRKVADPHDPFPVPYELADRGAIIAWRQSEIVKWCLDRCRVTEAKRCG